MPLSLAIPYGKIVDGVKGTCFFLAADNTTHRHAAPSLKHFDIYRVGITHMNKVRFSNKFVEKRTSFFIPCSALQKFLLTFHQQLFFCISHNGMR